MLALLFPGQGAQGPKMFENVLSETVFRERYEQTCCVTGIDVLAKLEAGETDILNSNLLSSLMTALVSSVALDKFKASSSVRPAFMAGYSVGQWSAMYAAGMLSFEGLVNALTARAALMDRCVAREPAAMCAVIGLPESTIEPMLASLRAEGRQVYISNYNCIGQYSIAGTIEAVQLAEEQIKDLNPRKLIRLPLAGGWHCPLLDEVSDAFSDFLDGLELKPPLIPIIDNVTGGWLPQDGYPLRNALARQINHPVRWEMGIATLLDAGGSDFVEVGYGRMLTSFGLFINRTVNWRTAH